MHRIKKLIGILFILGIVFFIICDEKGIKIEWDKDHIVLHQTVTSGSNTSKNIAYKTSDIIHIYPGFENPKNLRRSNGLDLEYIAKLEEERLLEQERLKAQEKVYTGPSKISINDETIFGVFQDNNEENKDSNSQNESPMDNEQDEALVTDEIQFTQNGPNNSTQEESGKVDQYSLTSDDTSIYKNSTLIKIYPGFANPKNLYYGSIVDNKDTNKSKEEINNLLITEELQSYGEQFVLDDNREEIIRYTSEIDTESINSGEKEKEDVVQNESVDISGSSINGKKTESDLKNIKPTKHIFSLKKGKPIEYFVVEDDRETISAEPQISDQVMENLLINDEIDINTLESENDEFLQKVFDATRDTAVMNLIVKNYLNEYQFVKAKRFIEGLPEMYRVELDPILNLRVSFNSFALTSKTTSNTLTSLVQGYASKNVISEEDKNRYIGVIALIDQNYDYFFELSNNFTSEKYKAFASKLQGYKDQISKQMGMPEYYFDTLVSLELFNQGLFQPAKVLALYSLQQNPNYILPYQVLAYANFLTNSRDTSVEYLKKLIDLDHTNAEKYRFLMGVASYWDEKYEQSVVMLSMIKDENLRLDAQRYLINDYLKLNQNNKLISSRNKLLGYENLVESDFYTYFYETFFHPYSLGEQFQLYALDTELANKMLRVCSISLQNDEKAVCTYGAIGKNIALGQFEGLEDSLLKLVAEYPQGYLYQSLGEYYIQHGDLEKAKIYLLKAVSLTQKKSELNQIKKLLQGII